MSKFAKVAQDIIAARFSFPTVNTECPFCLEHMSFTGWVWRCKRHGFFKTEELRVMK